MLAAGLFLQRRPDVDPRQHRHLGRVVRRLSHRARRSAATPDVFAAGVDLHGVHDRLPAVNPSQLAHAIVGDGITEDELKEALQRGVQVVADFDDRHVALARAASFTETTTARSTSARRSSSRARLVAKGVRVEELVLPDEVHDSLLWRSWIRTATAAAEFFERHAESQALKSA